MSDVLQPVDIVITWVDGNDIELSNKRQGYMTETVARDAASTTRFANNEEIYFCIASILKYVPYCGTIYVVTDNQKPEWLEQFAVQNICATDKIKVIDHRILFSGYESSLPTFNSLTIETMLWNIPGLSSRFIYLNDDVFMNAPSELSDCFVDEKVVIYGQWKSNFLIKMKYLFRKFLHQTMGKKLQPKFTTAQMLSADMVGLQRYYELHHRPHFIKTEVLQDYFMQHPEILKQQISFKFRYFEQFLPIGLANHLSIQQDLAILKPDEKVAYLKPDDDISRFLNALQNDEIKYGCIQSLDLMAESKQVLVRTAMIEKFGDFLPKELKGQVV
ncbi:Stealth CR1 domain-containing protein [Acinetobacter silvestris]|uniref:Capsular polysaccharide biosynthesis protein n=1 Tax=Acinetobacter silvestris TaxID=1977882 RepID=A0A1Y3CNC6_9GAMM|nr:Stealth CR1 domain-containing protein [Acinetobacter silvestris]OTG67354.1 capsular polysaccharide biosynthesis protein [Acinetobacter silvestris]